MKNATILHGTSGTPNSYWIPWLKRELEKIDYKVWVPQLPDSDNPNLKVQLPFILENGIYDEDTVLIGHSAGNPLILSILDHIDVKIKGVLQVAGFSENLTKVDKDLILQSSYNWEKMKNNVENLFFINSDNDPWGCDDVQGRKMFDKLGGNLLIRHGEGHMGSDTFNQPYKKFPLLLKIIESFS